MRIYITLKGDPEGSLPECPDTCYGRHPLRLWAITRRGRAWGHFATASINGQSVVIDASLPTEVTVVPWGARYITPEAVARLWHEDNESHVFGGPNVARMLRAAVKAANTHSTYDPDDDSTKTPANGYGS